MTSNIRSIATLWWYVVRGAKALRWWVTNLMGDRSYDVYVAHQRRHHPDDEILCEKNFWRAKYAEQDANPGARCC